MLLVVLTRLPVSNQVGLWYNLQPKSRKRFYTSEKVSNQVGLWYNLQHLVNRASFDISIMFQTKLDCGIICNEKINGGKDYVYYCFKPSWIVV